MTGQDILVRMNELLDAHTTLDCSVHQTGYKDDYFRLFAEAYKSGYFERSYSPFMMGDAIRDFFFTRWLTDKNEFNDKKLRKLNSVLSMWDEWYYTLNKLGIEI